MQTPDDRVNLVLAQCGETVGRPERALWELATRLPAARFHVQAWLNAAPELDELAAALEARDLHVERLPEAVSPWDLRRRLMLRLRVRRVRPGIVHMLLDRPCEGPAAALAEASSASLVVSFHGTSGTWGAPEALRLFERAALITAPYAAAAERVATVHGLDRQRIRIVPFGVDARPDEDEQIEAVRLRESLGVGFARPLWVSAARFQPEKGQAILLESATHLAHRGARFVIAFAGEGPARESLVARAAALGVTDSVRFVGPEVDLGTLLQAADAFVSTSFAEGIPNALLEAMARERPVVVGDVGGVRDIVEEGVTGLIVAPGNAEALADALHTLSTRPDPARRMGEAGAARVLSAFTWPRVIESHELVYDEALGLATFAPEHAEA